jgi:hypothetical protein
MYIGSSDFVIQLNQEQLQQPCRVHWKRVNPLNNELNPICYLLVLLGAHLILHVSRIRVKSRCVSTIKNNMEAVLIVTAVT